jgi:ABC-type nitrate/sulfonate/bicarbonate transport system substrate-binding protein
MRQTDPVEIERLWYTRCPLPCGTGIAIHHGWLNDEFARCGIEVTSLTASSDADVRASHFDHRQVNSFRQGGNAPPIWARSEGHDVVVVGLTWLPQYQSILALPGSDIKTVADLRGKRLALPRRVNEKMDFWRASALQGYLQALRSAGLGEADVEFVDLPVEQPYIQDTPTTSTGQLFGVRQAASSAQAEAFALIRGQVDVLYHYGATGPQLQEFLGARVVVDIARHSTREIAINNGTPNVLTVSGELLRNRPDLVARYVAQVLRASHWARTHRREAAAIFAREVSVAEDWMAEAFDDAMYDTLEPTLEPELVEALRVRKDFLLRHGFIRNDFSIDDWIDPGPLAAAHALLRG